MNGFWRHVDVLGLSLVLALVAGGCLRPRPVAETEAMTVGERHEFSAPQMGMPFRIVLYARNRAEAAEGARAAFARIEQLNGILSDYEDESELSRLSRTAGSGSEVALSPDLWVVLRRGQEIAHRSHGAFDVTVGPYVQLWRRARRQHALPEAARLDRARAAVGYRNLVLHPHGRTAELKLPAMRLDLGGIAKGYALDQAAQILRERGLPRFLVTGGGDMVAGDPPPGMAGWRIEVAPNVVSNTPPAQVVRLRNAALATSGDLYQYVELDGTRYSHIVDPRTGIGLTNRSQVTVIARDGMTADALATTVSVLGPQKGLSLVEREPRAAACVLFPAAKGVGACESRLWRRRLERSEQGRHLP